MIKRILMATDGSKTSVRALKTAVELAKKTRAKLILVGVIDNRLYTGHAMLAEDSPPGLQSPWKTTLCRLQAPISPTHPSCAAGRVSSPKSLSGRAIQSRKS